MFVENEKGSNICGCGNVFLERINCSDATYIGNKLCRQRYLRCFLYFKSVSSI